MTRQNALRALLLMLSGAISARNTSRGQKIDDLKRGCAKPLPHKKGELAIGVDWSECPEVKVSNTIRVDLTDPVMKQYDPSLMLVTTSSIDSIEVR